MKRFGLLGIFKAKATFYCYKLVSKECGMSRIIIFSRSLESTGFFRRDNPNLYDLNLMLTT